MRRRSILVSLVASPLVAFFREDKPEPVSADKAVPDGLVEVDRARVVDTSIRHDFDASFHPHATIDGELVAWFDSDGFHVRGITIHTGKDS